MFVVAIWKFGVMKTKQFAQNVVGNGNDLTSLLHV